MKLKLKNQSGTYSITDDSVRDAQINEINTNLVAMENVTGAKNLFDIEGFLSRNGITFVKNATPTYTFTLNSSILDDTLVILDHDELLTISGGTNGDIYIQLLDSNNQVITELGPGTKDYTGSFSKVKMVAALGFTPVDFSKPMIRPAGTDPTYVPYAMTNRQLTERMYTVFIPYNPQHSEDILWHLQNALNNGVFRDCVPFIGEIDPAGRGFMCGIFYKSNELWYGNIMVAYTGLKTYVCMEGVISLVS